ncbi:MAG: 50S ribosomal protein L35 [Defluviitaleaceae bacterium]|nr:50S ribosomal protein L35 [Defluviitaleaceae bacterium]MCL2836851.1 50S ribosomal protein L35 [Defluviitaleaceae bacterium]
MPKLKTNKAVAKRFRITGTGKLKRFSSGHGHFLEKKSPKRKRRLRSPKLVDKTMEKNYKRVMPYAK